MSKTENLTSNFCTATLASTVNDSMFLKSAFCAWVFDIKYPSSH